MSIPVESKEQWKINLMKAIAFNLPEARDIIMTRLDYCDSNNEKFSLDFNVDGYGNTFPTPLLLAIAHGHTELVQILLEAGAITEYNNSLTGFLPLQMATFYPRRAHMVRLLIKHGADILAVHQYCGTSTFQTAARYGRCTILEIFIDHADATGLTSIPSGEVFQSADESHSADCVTLMMRKGFIPSLTVGGNMFYNAALRKSTQMMSMMLAQSPMFTQLRKIKLQGVIVYCSTSFRHKYRHEYVELLTTLMLYCPSLQSQCKARILTAVGERYMEKVSQLPLPQMIIEYLQSLLSDFNITSQFITN